MTYLALDPGTSTGWARFSETGQLDGFGTLTSIEDLVKWMDSIPAPRVVIIEDFRLFSGKAKQQSGSTMPAARAIGVIESQAIRWGVEYVKQPANIKPIAVLYSGMKPEGAHKHSHWVDAYNHGYYYLVKTKVLKSRAVGIYE